jgi:uncharacterized protein
VDISEIIIDGDTPGVEWRLPVFRFKGASAAAPRTYIQAALHANELPGTALLHFLLEKLRQADEDGAILGDITIVPQANPIGAAQAHFGELQGRFDLGSRTNFNRDFPLISLGERDGLLDEPDRYSAIDRLKRHLLDMALGAELVLDLHCDDEGLQYAYIDEAFWPEAADLAAALDMEAVFLSDGQSSAFEEAVARAWKHESEGERRTALPGRLSVTVELRGTRDVYPDIALKDAEGMFRFLAGRGVVASTGAGLPAFAGNGGRCDPLPPQYRRQRRGRGTAGDHPGQARRAGRHRRGPGAAGWAHRHARLHPSRPPPVRPDEDRLRRAFACGAKAGDAGGLNPSLRPVAARNPLAFPAGGNDYDPIHCSTRNTGCSTPSPAKPTIPCWP